MAKKTAVIYIIIEKGTGKNKDTIQHSVKSTSPDEAIEFIKRHS